MEVAFLHLDLGIGGAESLVVSAALGLQQLGYRVRIFTAHCDKAHCFGPVKEGSLKVEVVGGWLPRQIFGRFTVLMAILRMTYICMYLILTGRKFEVVFNDQVSAINPLIKWFIAIDKTVFYCHYPDAYLCTDRGSWLKRLYRLPFDLIERYTISACSVVLVNSQFTASVLAEFAPGVSAVVVYPPASAPGPAAALPGEIRPPFFLSLNRFERKKNVSLALRAFAEFKAKNLFTLVIAGGFDSRVAENLEHFQELSQLAKDLEISSRVTFLKSVSDSARQALLRAAVAVIYTPSGEHFGIVPCEAMAVGTPVIACEDGGPKESVVDGVTGYLCEPGAPAAFARAMEQVAGLSDAQRRKMGDEGKKRVREFFSQSSFVSQLDKVIRA